MEDKKNQNQGSSFLGGLIIGALAAGLVVLLLDKEDKDNLRENLKSDWEKVLEKLKEIMESASKVQKSPPATVTVQDVEEDLGAKPITTPKVVNLKSVKKFFKKAGKQLKV